LVYEIRNKSEHFSGSSLTVIPDKVNKFINFTQRLQDNIIDGNLRIMGRLDHTGQVMINNGYVYFTKLPNASEVQTLLNDPASKILNRINDNYTVCMSGIGRNPNLLWTAKKNNKQIGL
jgi:hypothetical protein